MGHYLTVLTMLWPWQEKHRYLKLKPEVAKRHSSQGSHAGQLVIPSYSTANT